MRKPEGSDDAEERPAVLLFAQLNQLLEPQVVEQVHAHRVDGEYVDREVDSFGRAGRGVAVAVAAQDGDVPLGDELHRRGIQARPSIGHVPDADFVPATAVPDTNEQEVAWGDADMLGALGGGEVVGGHMVTGLQPRDTAQPRDVEENTAADDAVMRCVIERVDAPVGVSVSTLTSLQSLPS